MGFCVLRATQKHSIDTDELARASSASGVSYAAGSSPLIASGWKFGNDPIALFVIVPCMLTKESPMG
jgi:hypothetical protein